MLARRQTSIKVDPIAWDSAKAIFGEYNMSVSEAINLFLNKVRIEGGLPFDVTLPSDRLKHAIDQVEKDQVTRYQAADPVTEMMHDLKS